MKMSAPLSSARWEERLMDQILALFHQLSPEQQNQVLQRLQQSVQPSEVVQQNPPESKQQQLLEDSEQQTMLQKVEHTQANQQLQQNQVQRPQQEQVQEQHQQEQYNLQQMLVQQQQQIQELRRRHDFNRIEIYDIVITGLPAVILSATAGYAVFKLANSDKFIDALCDSAKLVTGAFVQRILPGSLCLSVVAETPEKGKGVMEACKSFELMDDLNHRIEKYESKTHNKVGLVTSVRIVSKRIDDVTSEQLELLKENAALCIEDIKKRSVEEYEQTKPSLEPVGSFGGDAKTAGQASEEQKFKALQKFLNDPKRLADAFLEMEEASKDEAHQKKLRNMYNTIQEIWGLQQQQQLCDKLLHNKYYKLLAQLRDVKSGI